MLNRILTAVIAVFLIAGCSGNKGQFAYKSMEMDMYRKFKTGMEFDSAEKINWIFKLNNAREEQKIGVVILKKELTWIEIDKYMFTVKPMVATVYGDFQNYPPGYYKIVLMRGMRQLDAIEFKIYSEE